MEDLVENLIDPKLRKRVSSNYEMISSKDSTPAPNIYKDFINI